eukprot:3853732-Rhodomonas_salina.4
MDEKVLKDLGQPMVEIGDEKKEADKPRKSLVPGQQPSPSGVNRGAAPLDSEPPQTPNGNGAPSQTDPNGGANASQPGQNHDEREQPDNTYTVVEYFQSFWTTMIPFMYAPNS